MKKKKSVRIARSIYLLLIVLFFYVPLAYIIVFSFNESASYSRFTGFSFKWYISLFTGEKPPLVEAIWNTIICAFLSTIISTIIGTIGSIGLMKVKKKNRDRLLWLNNLPVLNPDIVTAIGLMFVFNFLLINKIQSDDIAFIKMLIAHISFCVPFVVITVYPKIKTLDSNALEAAMDLGSTPAEAIGRVLVPQLKTAVLSAASLAFTMSFDDYAISYFVTSGQLQNVSIYLTTTGKKTDLSINAFSAIVIVIIVVIIIVRFITDMKHYKKIQK